MLPQCIKDGNYIAFKWLLRHMGPQLTQDTWDKILSVSKDTDLPLDNKFTRIIHKYQILGQIKSDKGMKGPSESG